MLTKGHAFGVLIQSYIGITRHRLVPGIGISSSSRRKLQFPLQTPHQSRSLHALKQGLGRLFLVVVLNAMTCAMRHVPRRALRRVFPLRRGPVNPGLAFGGRQKVGLHPNGSLIQALNGSKVVMRAQ